MSTTAHFDHARKVADAILYEGYLLYPYHQSAGKNQSRFQFGVLMPPAYRDVDANEPSRSQTECLVECADNALVHVWVRFLHLRHRRAQPAGQTNAAASVVDDVEPTAWAESL